MILASLLCATDQAASEVWPHQRPVKILKQAYQRLYFDAGSEYLIRPGCRFSIQLADSSTLDGTIESSQLGISVSAAIDTLATLQLPDSAIAQVDVLCD